jgi:cation:H+ antiporter
VLAITALIAPMPIQRHLLTQEIPVLLLVTTLAGVILWDTTVTLTEGIILLGSIGPLLYLMAKHKKEHPEESDNDEIPELSLGAASAWFVIGLGTLIASSEMLVWGATLIATDFGVSPLIIGLTVVAVGTSLPELAASVMSAVRGHHEMALGNIIGSNIFNILTVMAVPGLISPPIMESAVFSRDYLAMGGMTLLLVCAIGADYVLRNKGGNGPGHARLGRRIGTTLLLAYIAYYVVLFS